MSLVSERVVSCHSDMLNFVVDFMMSHDIKSTDDFKSSSCSRCVQLLWTFHETRGRS